MEVLLPILALGTLVSFPKKKETDTKEPFDNLLEDKSQQVYTDKYFSRDAGLQYNPHADLSSTFKSVTGEMLTPAQFTHNNMAPFFRGAARDERASDKVTETLLDNYAGKGSQHIAKREQAPLFAPTYNSQLAFGTPNQTDIIREYVADTQSKSMNGIAPFQSIKVSPGLAGSDGSGQGYNSALNARDLFRDRDVDQLRVLSKPKAGGIKEIDRIQEGYGGSCIGARGIQAPVNKNRAQREAPLGEERLLRTLGVARGERPQALQMLPETHRQSGGTHYVGGAANPTLGGYQQGSYREGFNQSLPSLPLMNVQRERQGAPSMGDHGREGSMVYSNQRSIGMQETHFGPMGRENMGEAIAPHADKARHTRKETVDLNARPFANVSMTVKDTYIYDPRDVARPTIKESTIQSLNHLNFAPGGAGVVTTRSGYDQTNYLPGHTKREELSSYYSGGASALSAVQAFRIREAEERQKNNEKKPATNVTYTPNGAISLYNNQIQMRSKDKSMANERENFAAMPYSTPARLDSETHMNSSSLSMPDRNNADLLAQLKDNPFIVPRTREIISKSTY